MMNSKKISLGYKIFTGFNITFLSVLSIVTLYPLLYVLFAAFSDSAALAKHSGILFGPAGFSTVAIEAVINNPNILNGYKNTMFLMFFGVSFQVLMTSIGAYFFSRRDVMFKNVLMFTIVFTMFFQGGMVPFYILVNGLGLRNSLLSLVIPFSISAYNLIIMKTSFGALPVSLEESAKLDGASHFTILFRIIMPLSKPVIAVMFLYYGVGIWNGWFWASLFINDRTKYPLQLILREILTTQEASAASASGGGVVDQVGIGETIKYATIVVSTVPILFAYPFIQKYFAKGVLIGAVKG